MTRLAFTGHRPDKLGGFASNPQQRRIRAHIRLVLQTARPSEVISGLAQGIDWWAAEEAISMGIPVTGAMPFVGQESRWPKETQQAWRVLVARCMRTFIISPGGYTRKKMQVRNEWMVNNAHILVAYFDGTTGGTKNCVTYAQAVGRDVVIFNPHEV